MSSKSSIEKTMEILIATEMVADKILANKQEIVALDKRRQETREAIRETTKQAEGTNVWITIGSMLVKLKREKALELLERDKIQIDIEINKLRCEQKILVNQHRDLEHLEPFKGSSLKAMSTKEMSAIKANLPRLG